MDNRFSVNGLAPHPELNHKMGLEGLREKNDTLMREIAFLYGQLYEERLRLSKAVKYMNEFRRLYQIQLVKKGGVSRPSV